MRLHHQIIWVAQITSRSISTPFSNVPASLPLIIVAGSLTSCCVEYVSTEADVFNILCCSVCNVPSSNPPSFANNCLHCCGFRFYLVGHRTCDHIAADQTGVFFIVETRHESAHYMQQQQSARWRQQTKRLQIASLSFRYMQTALGI